jgi:hypothetical protein
LGPKRKKETRFLGKKNAVRNITIGETANEPEKLPALTEKTLNNFRGEKI